MNSRLSQSLAGLLHAVLMPVIYLLGLGACAYYVFVRKQRALHDAFGKHSYVRLASYKSFGYCACGHMGWGVNADRQTCKALVDLPPFRTPLLMGLFIWQRWFDKQAKGG